MEKQQRCFMLIDNDERNQSNEKKKCAPLLSVNGSMDTISGFID